MKKFSMILLVLVLFPVSQAMAEGRKASVEDMEGITEIDADTLQKLWKEKEGFTVIDSRGGKYFDGIMIKGALHLPANEVTAETLAEKIASESTPVAFYCVNPECPASGLSAYKAKDLGYTELYVYEGGIEDWVAKGLPTVEVE